MTKKIIFFFVAYFSLPLWSAPLIKPEVIYGADDRIDFYQISAPQWRSRASSTVALIRNSKLNLVDGQYEVQAESFGTTLGLCPTEPFYDQIIAPFCSGFLVAPDIVITAGHCISNQQACNSTRFVFDFRIDQAGQLPRSISPDRVFACTEIIKTIVTQGEDFAVARLDRPVTHTPPLNLRRFDRPTVNTPLVVIGHPAGLPLKLAGGANVRSISPEFLTANLDTYGGNSGSAVFNAVTGDVEGILVRGEVDYNLQNGCRVSNRCDNNKCRGEDVTLIERVLPSLTQLGAIVVAPSLAVPSQNLATHRKDTRSKSRVDIRNWTNPTRTRY